MLQNFLVSEKCSTFAMYLGDTGTLKFNILKNLTIMATKVKIQREFTFKAYVVANTQETAPAADQHTGEYMTKSECHYYCEKAVLDMLKANADKFDMYERDSMAWCIYKVCTLDDESKQFGDVLVEIISIKGGMINIH